MKDVHPARRAATFTWSVWAAMTVAGLWLAAVGRDLPYTDDWLISDAVAGVQPVRPRWLWKQWNDHRIPLVKVVLAPLYRAVSYDCRYAIALNVALLSAGAGSMIWAAARVRGHTSYADAFFPLAFLGWGHNSLAWGFQFQFVASTVLTTSVLAAMVLRGDRLGPWSAAVAGAALVALPLCGSNGLAFVPALAAWAALFGVEGLRSGVPRGRLAGGILALSAAAVVALVLLYFYHFNPAKSLTKVRPSLMEQAQAMAMIAATNFGSTAGRLATIAPAWVPRLARLVEPCLLLAAVVTALGLARFREERPRAVGLLLFLAANLSLIAGIAWGRSGLFLPFWAGHYDRDNSLGPNSAVHSADMHYSVLLVPALCGAFFAFLVASRHRRGFAGLNAALAVLMAVATVAAIPDRLTDLRCYQDAAANFRRDVRDGESAAALAARHSALFFVPSDPYNVVSPMRMVRDAGLGVFGKIKGEPTPAEPPTPKADPRR